MTVCVYCEVTRISLVYLEISLGNQNYYRPPSATCYFTDICLAISFLPNSILTTLISFSACLSLWPVCPAVATVLPKPEPVEPVLQPVWQLLWATGQRPEPMKCDVQIYSCNSSFLHLHVLSRPIFFSGPYSFISSLLQPFLPS